MRPYPPVCQADRSARQYPLDLFDGQRGGQLGGVKRDEDDAAQHPQQAYDAREPLSGQRLNLRHERCGGERQCLKYAREITSAWARTLIVAPVEEPEQMRRNYDDEDHTELNERRARKQQSEHIPQRRRLSRSAIAHHNLLTGFHNRVREVKLLISLSRIEDDCGAEVGVCRSNRLEGGVRITCHLVGSL